MRFLKSKTIINLLILLGIFLVSIIVRWDNLKDPLGRHHEWLTGHVLSTIATFEKDGASEHYFAPVWTFNTEADRYVVSFQSFKDKNNYTYYVSYPPLCFLLPHYIFKIFGINASVIGIRVIGLIIQFLIGFVLYLLLLRMFKKSFTEDVFLPGLMAFSFYTFASGNLWFHCHVWFADMLVPLFIVSLMYLVYRILEDSISTKKAFLFLLLIAALGAYTEWQMLFVSFATCTLFFFKGFKNKKFFLFFGALAVSTLITLYVVYNQYSSIAGTKELTEVLTSKYKQRSGEDVVTSEAGMGINNSFSFQNISEHYERNYSLLLDYGWYALIVGTLLLIFNRMLERKIVEGKHVVVFMIILSGIVLHHYVFFNFTAIHDFSTLKSSLFISLLCGYVLAFYSELFLINSSKMKNISFIIVNLLLIGLFFHFSTKSYYNVNQLSKLDKNNIVLGEIINNYAKPNEIVFCSIPVSPEATWYAKRNIITVANLKESVLALQRINSKLNGVFVNLKADKYEVIKHTTKGDTLYMEQRDYSTLNCLKKN